MPQQIYIFLKSSAIAAIIVSSIGSAHAQNNQTEYCEKLIQFANSLADDHSRFVELSTFWGVKIEGNRVTIGEQSCMSDSSDAGKAYCAFLVNHSSTEFPEMNFKRVFKCLTMKEAFASEVSIQPKHAFAYIDKSLVLKNELAAVLTLDATETGAQLKVKIERVEKEIEEE